MPKGSLHDHPATIEPRIWAQCEGLPAPFAVSSGLGCPPSLAMLEATIEHARRGDHAMRRRDLLLGATVAVAAPRSLRAQKAMPVIGYLGIGSPETDRTLRLEPFRLGLQETGYVEGQNVVIEYRWGRGQYDRLPELPAEVVRQQVRVSADKCG